MNDTIMNFWQVLASVSIGIIVTLLSFWASISRSIVSKDEIVEMIRKDSEYSHDKQFIMERLNSHKEDTSIVFRALEKNTEVMTELKIQIATLAKTLEALEYRIERT